jgi:hypothetical protein
MISIIVIVRIKYDDWAASTTVLHPSYPIPRSDGQKNPLQNRRRLRGHSDGSVAYRAFSSIVCEGVT